MAGSLFRVVGDDIEGVDQVTLPAGHYGTTSDLQGPPADATLACTTNLTVSGDDNGTVLLASYAVTEGGVSFAASATPVAGRTAPVTAVLTVTDAAGKTVMTDSLAMTTPVTYSSLAWLAPGVYDAAIVPQDVDPVFWKLGSTFTVTATQDNAPESWALTEKTSTVLVTVTGAAAGTEATIAISPGAGQDATLPVGYDDLTTVGGQVTVVLPSGRWDAAVTLPGGVVQVTTVEVTSLQQSVTLSAPPPTPSPSVTPDPEPTVTPTVEPSVDPTQ